MSLVVERYILAKSNIWTCLFHSPLNATHEPGCQYFNIQLYHFTHLFLGNYYKTYGLYVPNVDDCVRCGLNDLEKQFRPGPSMLIAAREDAERVVYVAFVSVTKCALQSSFGRSEREQDTVAGINLHTITKQEAQLLESLEHKL